MTARLDRSIVIATLALVACGGNPPEPPAPLRPVRTIVVSEEDGTRTRTFSGVARAGVESELSFRVAGRIEQIHVRVGQTVEPSQLIAELDASDFSLQVQQAEAQLASSRAQDRNGRANYERVRELYENNNASRADLDSARAAAESGRAQVSSSSMQLRLARSQLSYTKLRAAVAGAISSIPGEVGENVAAGTPVAVLTSGDQIEVELTIPEALIGAIHTGDAVTVQFDALEGQTFGATVNEVGVASTGASTTYPVTLLLNEVNGAVRPGMAAEASFSFVANGGEARFVLPPVAVGEDRDGRFVFLVETAGEEARVVRRPVTVGELTSEGIEVLTGVSTGDVVVTAGVRRLRDGMAVKPPEVAAPQP